MQRAAETQRELAYEAGAASVDENILKRSSQTLQNGNESDTINTESGALSNEGTDGVYLRDGGERYGSTNPEGQVRSVEGGTGQTARGQRGTGYADGEIASLLNEGREVTVANLGILGGSATKTVRLLDGEGETASMKAAKAVAEKNGVKVKFFAGDNLTITDKNGKEISVRAYISKGFAFVRADHPLYTAEQLMRHEAGHHLIEEGKIDLDEVRGRLVDIVGEEDLDAVARMYTKAYDGSEMTAEEIWEECVCDSLGDMNIFAGDAKIRRFMADILPEIKTAAESQVKEANETRGPPAETSAKAGEKQKSAEEPKGDAKTSRETVDNYSTDGVHWGIEDGIISKADARIVWEAIANIEKRRYNSYIKTVSGNYIVETDNALMVLDSDYRNPVVREIYSFKDNESYAKEALKNGIARENELEIQESKSAIEMVLGKGYVVKYAFKDSEAYGRQNGRRKGSDSGRNTEQTKIREWRFDDESDIKTSRELDFIDYLNEEADLYEYVDSVEENSAETDEEVRSRLKTEKSLTNRQLLATALESVSSYPREKAALTNYRAALESISKAERRIDILDGQLLKLESTKALKKLRLHLVIVSFCKLSKLFC